MKRWVSCGNRVQVLVRIVRDLSTGTIAMVENEKFFAQIGTQPSLIQSIVESACEARMRVDEFVKELILACERYKLSGSSSLNFSEAITWSASELVFHFKCINRVYEALEYPEAKRMLRANLEVIRELEALLACVLSFADLPRVLAAEIEAYPD